MIKRVGKAIAVGWLAFCSRDSARLPSRVFLMFGRIIDKLRPIIEAKERETERERERERTSRKRRQQTQRATHWCRNGKLEINTFYRLSTVCVLLASWKSRVADNLRRPGMRFKRPTETVDNSRLLPSDQQHRWHGYTDMVSQLLFVVYLSPETAVLGCWPVLDGWRVHQLSIKSGDIIIHLRIL